MNNVIFWIIVCSWLIPMGIRMYNRSRQRRLRDGEYGGTFPGNPPGPYIPGQDDQRQGEQGPYTPGRYDPRPYDPSRYPPNPYNPNAYNPTPYNPAQPPVATPAPQATPPSSATPPTNGAPQKNGAPQGYRARKLFELDQEYSDGKIAMEDYMKLRQEIMNG